jgi:hypothetical protein
MENFRSKEEALLAFESEEKNNHTVVDGGTSLEDHLRNL